MDVTKYEIVVSRHAFIRSIERGITPDMYLATIKGGEIKEIGKHLFRFSKEYKHRTIICIGVKQEDWIKIITIECVLK